MSFILDVITSETDMFSLLVSVDRASGVHAVSEQGGHAQYLFVSVWNHRRKTHRLRWYDRLDNMYVCVEWEEIHSPDLTDVPYVLLTADLSSSSNTSTLLVYTEAPDGLTWESETGHMITWQSWLCGYYYKPCKQKKSTWYSILFHSPSILAIRKSNDRGIHALQSFMGD